MHTDIEKRQAVEQLLSLFPDIGLHKLRVEEVARLCEYLGAAIDEASRESWRNGWDSGWRHAIEFIMPRLIKSATGH